jgi:hypothetical protein
MSASIWNPANSVEISSPFTHASSYAASTVGGRLVLDIYPEDAPYNAVGDGVTDDTVAINAAIAGLTSGQTLHLTQDYACSGDVLITNKSRINITGPGRLKFITGTLDATLLKCVGTCSDIRITGVSFEGEGNTGATYFQRGIYNNSGQTLSNILVAYCSFRNLNVGVAFNAESSGSAVNCFALYNTIEDITGVVGGQGYGIFASKITNVQIIGNDINRCQRHSIYVSRGSTVPGTDFGSLVHSNIIRDHRSTVATLNTYPAIMCVRGYGYSIKNNKLINYKDGGIMVIQDTVDLTSAGFSVIEGNELNERKNAVFSIMAGEQLDPTSYHLRNVRIANNNITTDISVGGYQHEIYVPNGTNVDIVDNRLYVAAIPNSTYAPIGIGEFSAAGVTDLDNIFISRNVFRGSLASAFTPTSQYLVKVFDDACTSASRIRIVDNDWDEEVMIGCAAFPVTQTNTKCIVQERGGLRTGIYIAGDTTPTVGLGMEYVGVANSGAINITSLDDGVGQQKVTLGFADGNTTLKHATGNLRLAGGVDFVSTSRDVVTLIYSSAAGQWWESGRSVNA